MIGASAIDDTTGVVYLNNRYHDPTLGQFICVDPLVTITGEAYIYGGANPITFSDPSGLSYGCGVNGCIDDYNTIEEQQFVAFVNQHEGTSATLDEISTMPHLPQHRASYRRDTLAAARVGFNERFDAGRPFNWYAGDVFGAVLRAATAGQDEEFSIGVDSGCWVFVCLQVGIDSGGPYANVGAGLVVASPSVVGSRFDNPRDGTKKFFASARGGLVSVILAEWEWDDDEFVRDGEFVGPSAAIDVPTPKNLFPRFGGGFVRTWNFG